MSAPLPTPIADLRLPAPGSPIRAEYAAVGPDLSDIGNLFDTLADAAFDGARRGWKKGGTVAVYFRYVCPECDHQAPLRDQLAGAEADLADHVGAVR